jgi:hypothetical protein
MNWEEIAKALWGLLDDIDTLSDMYKPGKTPYFEAVAERTARRFDYLESDGYGLFLPGSLPEPSPPPCGVVDQPPDEPGLRGIIKFLRWWWAK